VSPGRGSRLRRLAIGEAGVAPALVLAGVAVVVSFISVFGTRALDSADNSATGEAVRQLPVVDAGVLVTADLTAWPRTGTLPAARIGHLGDLLASDVPRPQDFLIAQRWGSAIMPALAVPNAAPSATCSQAPKMEVAYRAPLAAHATLAQGSMPEANPTIEPGGRGQPPTVTFPVAVTRATAQRFSLKIGSVLQLLQPAAGDPNIGLKVSGILQPKNISSSFWQIEPALAVPSLQYRGPNDCYWIGGAFLGPAGVSALPRAFQGQRELVSWFVPLRKSLTAAEVPKLESVVNVFASSPGPRDDEGRLGAGDLHDTTVTAGLAQGLSGFTEQWHIVQRSDSLLLVGLFVAGALLLFSCSELAADAYRPELVIIRVRGGSLGQLSGRMLARTILITLPALVIGAAVAIALRPASDRPASWLLGGLTAVVALGSLPVIAVVAHRQRRLAGTARRDETVASRPRLRRLIVELLVVLVAAAAVVDLRLRGSVSSATSVYLSGSAVLVAAAVGLIVNRAYPPPLRVLARLAAAGRGPVGAVGLARAARARAGVVGPALALMLTLTLVAFSAMVLTAVSTGQVAASWAQVGADANIAVPGLTGARLTGVTPAELKVISAVPGVRHATAVYTASSEGSQTVNVITSGHASQPLGIAVIDPRSYGKVAGDSPWPGFPAGALTEPRSGPNGVVPILTSPGVAAGPGSRLAFAGLSVPVKVVGTITATPAMPTGGSYVVLPRWAAFRLPALPRPLTVLATGPAIDGQALRQAARRVFPSGVLVTLRPQVLSQLADSPAQHLSESLYVSGAVAAAGLSALAVLFALAGSARSRARMMTRLAALGLSRSQALALGLTDALPLLIVGAVGSAVSGWLLAEVLGPVLGLGVFTNSAVPVTLRPVWPAVVVPIAVAVVLSIAYLLIDGLAAGRREIGSVLRYQEAGQT
jgi:putative ABC transport system permease protein